MQQIVEIVCTLLIKWCCKKKKKRTIIEEYSGVTLDAINDVEQRNKRACHKHNVV